MRNPHFLIAVGGAGPPSLPHALGDDVTVVAADSGLDALVACGLPVHHVVGDLDSASPEALAAAEAAGAVIHRHEPDKDATDLELAVQLVTEELVEREVVPDDDGTDRLEGTGSLRIAGPGGGRLDHLLADLLLLSSHATEGFTVEVALGPSEIVVVRDGLGYGWDDPSGVGQIVSLLPVHGPARGVSTSGLRWPLHDADLAEGTTRGMSNEIVDARVDIDVREGVLLVIRPGNAAPAVPPRTAPYDPTPRSEP